MWLFETVLERMKMVGISTNDWVFLLCGIIGTLAFASAFYHPHSHYFPPDCKEVKICQEDPQVGQKIQPILRAGYMYRETLVEDSRCSTTKWCR